jgi:nitrogen regulatory protein PII
MQELSSFTTLAHTMYKKLIRSGDECGETAKGRCAMKMVEAVIQQLKLEEVRNALDETGVEDFMESPILCHTHQKGQAMMFRGARFVADIVDRVKLEIIAADDSVGNIIEAIGSIARTGRKEDCRIAIRPYLEVS